MPKNNRTIRGLRDRIPGGYVVGRLPGRSTKAPGLISLKDIIENAYPTRGSVGGSGGTTSKVIAFETFIAGTMSTLEVVGQWIVPRVSRLPLGLATSFARSKTAATGSTVLTIAKVVAGVATTIGTVTFAAAAVVGTFSFLADVDFAAGDMIRLTGPAGVDGTLADVTVLLYGSYT